MLVWFKCWHAQILGGLGAWGEFAVNRTELKSAALGAVVTALAFVIGREAMALARPAIVSRAALVVEAAPAEILKPGSCELEMAANRNLVEQVREYRDRADRTAGEPPVAEALTEDTSEASALPEPPAKSEWDLSAEELTDLAKLGSVKQRVPCSDRHGWRPTPDALEKLGLAPHDGLVLEEAALHAYEQSWKTIKDVCTSLPEGQAPEPLQRDECVNAIYLSLAQSDPEGTDAAVRRASEARAGMRPSPWVGSRLHPVEKIALALAEAQKSYEQELTRSLGPEDGHRAAFSDDLCTTYVAWEGSPRGEM